MYYVCMYACMYVCTHACMYVKGSSSIRAVGLQPLSTFTCIYVVYIYMYTYTHAYKLN